jgi:hypothetical protein
VGDFSSAIRLRPDLPLPYFARGNVYLHHLDKKKEAMADYAKGCKLGSSLCCQELDKLKAEKK